MQNDIPPVFQDIAQAVVNEWNGIHFSNETTLQKCMVSAILNPYKRGTSANVIDYHDYDLLLTSPDFYTHDDKGENSHPKFSKNHFISFARFAKAHFNDSTMPIVYAGYSALQIPVFVQTPELPNNTSMTNRLSSIDNILGPWLDTIENDKDFESATKVYDALLVAVEQAPELISEEALYKLEQIQNDPLELQKLLDQNNGLRGDDLQQQTTFVESLRNTEGVRAIIDHEMTDDSFAKYNLLHWLELLFCATLEDE